MAPQISGIESGKGIQEVVPMWKFVLVASIAAGIQFGWALQLSLLTPYVQTLGVPHTISSYMWLCGPVSGLVVQPIVGYFSDRCKSRFGRRRPYIMSGAFLVTAAILLIGFAADIGHHAGDVMTRNTKPRAVAVFIVGTWILDVANNMLQGPCRAFLADLAAGDEKRMAHAMALYSFFMAVGSVAGYGAGGSGNIHKLLPFTRTHACQEFCANLKSAFLIQIVILLGITFTALSVVKDPRFNPVEDGKKGGGLMVFVELFNALKNLSKPMWLLMFVTFLNWIGWFPFVLYDTDWMGREVYGGKPGQSVFYMGVRAGSIGLLLNSVVLGVISILLCFFAKGAKAAKTWWFGVNILLAVGLALTVLVSHHAERVRVYGANSEALPPSSQVKNSALAIFAVLGIPLSVTYTVPFALAAIYCNRNTGGAGQGLSLGVMNLAICVPQIIVALSSGPLDSAFGGGNLPAFIMGAIGAFLSGVLAFVLLPTPKDGVNTLAVGGGGH